VIPEGTQLAPRNPGVEAWDTLPESHQKFACRLQEAFAAFLDHTDDQIGRLVEGIRNMGELDNTIFVVLADNGASQEGGPFGVMHEMKFFNGLLEDPDDVMDRLDDIGGPDSHTNYPWGWSQCGNSPFKWYKQNTHEGGVHVPMVFHWPAGIDQSQAGSKRNQFVNVSDITPTIYEILGVTAPEVFKGIDQMPVTGDSFVSTLSDPAAPATNTIQYFENGGSRALIVEQDGVWWKAVARHQAGVDFEDDTWELYRLSDDMSECNDVAGDSPDKLTELIELWWSEAERNGVLPLDDRGLELFAPHLSDTSPHRLDRTYVYRPPMSPIPAQPSPSPGGRSWDMTASVTRAAGDEGVIWATGSASSGISIFVQNDRLLIDYNSFDERTVLESDIVVPEGDCVLGVSLARNSRTTGIMSIAIDGEAAGSAELPFMMRMISSLGASVGMDFGSQVSQQYTGTFPFTGTLHQIEIQLGQRSRKDAEATAKTEMSRQ
jgi:arylsulfatase